METILTIIITVILLAAVTFTFAFFAKEADQAIDEQKESRVVSNKDYEEVEEMVNNNNLANLKF